MAISNVTPQVEDVINRIWLFATQLNFDENTQQHFIID